ncbi:MAG: acyl-CoA dehydrogenase family protein, partial [Candidatus Xenobia bacterium]
MSISTRPPVAPGGSFLTSETLPEQVFTPDDFSEEQRMIQQSTTEFVNRELLPRLAALEKNSALNRELVAKAAEVGLLALEIPEAYGGLDMDKACAMIVTECLGRYESFGVTYAGHTGIGTQPIYSFGTEAQKQKYLPQLGEGKLISAYALTEPGSGSDALGARTRADLSADGTHYVVNGSKMWITNAGFCDMFIAFAKVDGDKFTCFIVDRHAPGVTVGEEEKKMGQKGSSTRAVTFDNVQVPVENLVGEIGKGHQIAFNALNLGRFKLGAASYGTGIVALHEALEYAEQRTQFGKPIVSFGAIQHKLAQMAVRLYVLRSMNSRTAGLIDSGLAAVDRSDPKQVMKAIENYSVECSILKVHGTETLDFVVDEEVQVFGGYGFSAEYPAERRYRDSRVNRIFEGTNEINRLVITTRLLKKGNEGELALMDAIKRAGARAAENKRPTWGSNPLDRERAIAQAAKDVTLYLAGLAFQKHGKGLGEQQEVVSLISDAVILTYAVESATLRAAKKGGAFEYDLVRTFAS